MRRLTVLTATCVGLMLVAAGCNHDGRYLRPAAPDQNATISTTVLATTVPASDIFASDPIVTDVTGAIESTESDAFAPTSAEPTTTLVADDPTTTTVAVLPSAIAPWRQGAPIDGRYTCVGANVSPPMSWSAAPAGTVEIAITMSDDQAPSFVHWAIAGINPSSTSIPEGVVLPGVIRGINGSGTLGYTGPCPPAGQQHTYQVTIHYLESQIELGDGAGGAEMVVAINAATFAQAVVTGTSSRP